MEMMLAFGMPGLPELLIIGLVVLLLFGSTKIPQLMRGMGSGISEFKKGLKEGADEEKKSEKTEKSEEKEKKESGSPS